MANQRDSNAAGMPGERRLIGTLRDALAAAAAPSRPAAPLPPPLPVPSAIDTAGTAPPSRRDTLPAATDAARESRGALSADESGDDTGVPQTRVARASSAGRPQPRSERSDGRTQLIRGKVSLKRTDFHQDPVVGWLVVVGGPGLGAFRPVFEGNNTIGRATSQRIPLDFGDETISSEEQAYLRYDSVDRTFLLVPNLSKTNIVAVNDKKPTGATELQPMDLITMGRTQLAFVPFCGADFDWAELQEIKG